MAQPTPQSILGTWMDRAWNKLDVTVVDDLLAPDAIVHGLGEAPLIGREAWRGFHAAFMAAFSKIDIVQEEQISSGDVVGLTFTAHLTHRGTGKNVSLKGMTMGRVVNGQMVEGWNFVDFMPLFVTLGMLAPDAMEQALRPPASGPAQP